MSLHFPYLCGFNVGAAEVRRDTIRTSVIRHLAAIAWKMDLSESRKTTRGKINGRTSNCVRYIPNCPRKGGRRKWSACRLRKIDQHQGATGGTEGTRLYLSCACRDHTPFGRAFYSSNPCRRRRHLQRSHRPRRTCGTCRWHRERRCLGAIDASANVRGSHMLCPMVFV
jgi:hypothetical protein